MILWWAFKGFHVIQMNSMVPGTHLGVVICPNPFLFNYQKHGFARISGFPGKLRQSPACFPHLLASYPVLYATWALARVGGMAEGLLFKQPTSVVIPRVSMSSCTDVIITDIIQATMHGCHRGIHFPTPHTPPTQSFLYE